MLKNDTYNRRVSTVAYVFEAPTSSSPRRMNLELTPELKGPSSPGNTFRAYGALNPEQK